MKRDNINALNAPQPRGGYSQAVSIEDFRRVLFISGQIPVNSDEVVPEGFEAQARQVWRNVDAQLKAAGMSKT
ncbi:enamine deaminase RidA, partial [Sinorhizobium medicae]